MSVRTFTTSQSLNESIASMTSMATANPEANPSPSLGKNAINSFPETSQNPLSRYKQNHKPGITFAHEDQLPKLPIPDLEASCKKYLDALRPLQTGREHEESIAAVQEFLKSEGPELQERLKKYAGGRTSYIEQFCK
jgi:carnitine O-acetyltransferase